MAILGSFTIAVLSVLASLSSFWIVSSVLRGDEQRALRRDVKKVVEVYAGNKETEEYLTGPTGRVAVQLYDSVGTLFVGSSPAFERSTAALPREIVLAAMIQAQDWQGKIEGTRVQVALAPFDMGVVAVISDMSYIGNVIRRIGLVLLFTALSLVVLSGVIGYWVAGLAIKPITSLARVAAKMGPMRLAPVGYEGPDDEVGELSQVLNALIARLKVSIDGQREFLAETSHELRTPLTSLKGFLVRALRHSNSQQENDLRDASRIADGMARLVEDLLELSRGELLQGNAPSFVQPLQDILQPVAAEFPGLRVTGNSEVGVIGDPDRLRQLIRNLAANALRAVGDPTRVVLRLQTDEDTVILRVCDDGPGIPEEIQPYIFKKFYKGAGGGVGLGLAIAQQIAKQHGAEIKVKSRAGETIFSVLLTAVSRGS